MKKQVIALIASFAALSLFALQVKADIDADDATSQVAAESAEAVEGVIFEPGSKVLASDDKPEEEVVEDEVAETVDEVLEEELPEEDSAEEEKETEETVFEEDFMEEDSMEGDFVEDDLIEEDEPEVEYWDGRAEAVSMETEDAEPGVEYWDGSPEAAAMPLEAPSDEDEVDEWYADYAFDENTSGENTLILKKYFGSAADIVVKSSANYKNQTWKIRLADYYDSQNGIWNGTEAAKIKIEPGVILPSDCGYMFYANKAIESVDMSGVDMSKVTGIDCMFYACSELKSVKLSGCDLSKVLNADDIFGNCSALNEIVAPCYLWLDIPLPRRFSDEALPAQTYDALPKNLASSKTLKFFADYEKPAPEPDPQPTPDTTPETIAVSGISLNTHELSLSIGESVRLVHKITPDGASNKRVSWLSDDASVATVDENGLVKAVAPGTMTVMVTSSDNGMMDACSVTVNEPEIVVDSSESWEPVRDDRKGKNEEDRIRFDLDTASGSEYLVLKDTDGTAIKRLILKKGLSYSRMAVYDLELRDSEANGSEVSGFGRCSISIPLPDNMNPSNGTVRVYSVKGGALETLSGTSTSKEADGSWILNFSTTHFSQFAILYKAKASSSGSSGSTTGSGQTSSRAQTGAISQNQSTSSTQSSSSSQSIATSTSDDDDDDDTVYQETKKPKFTKVVWKGSERSEFFWKKGEDCDGYVLQYSTSGSFKKGTTRTVKVKGNAANITGLEKNKKYYLRVRSYENIGKDKLWGSWSHRIIVERKR